MNCFGQLSLEYLLLLLAALAAFALILPILGQVYNAAFFALDSSLASDFSDSMQARVFEMSFEADGAKAVLKAKPLGKWLVFSQEKRLVVRVFGLKEKDFVVVFPNKVAFNERLVEAETEFFLSKSKGALVLE